MRIVRSSYLHRMDCFVAFKIYKELERILSMLDLKLRVDSVIKIAKTITTVRLKLPLNGKI